MKRVGKYLAMAGISLCLVYSLIIDRPGRLWSAQEGGKTVGGPCTYATYPGTATIVSVRKTGLSKAQAALAGGPGYEGYEVRFRFTTTITVKEPYALEKAEEEQVFLLANSWYPGERYIKKYGIEAGKSYPCELKAILTGTCTPVLFEITGLAKDDYFESSGRGNGAE